MLTSSLTVFLIDCGIFLLLFLLAGESDAQAASPFPQCHLCLLRWEPAAVGTDPQAVQHKAQTARSRQTVLAGGAVKVPIAPPGPALLFPMTSLLPRLSDHQPQSCSLACTAAGQQKADLPLAAVEDGGYCLFHPKPLLFLFISCLSLPEIVFNHDNKHNLYLQSSQRPSCFQFEQ